MNEPHLESDEALLARVARADGDALERLYERQRGMAFALAARITGDTELAADVVQDSFVGIWRNASRYAAARASARTWVMAIVHHRAIDAVRRRQPAGEPGDADAPPPAGLVIPDGWPAMAPPLDRAVLMAALATLPAAQREAVELGYLSGLSPAGIAARTGVSPGTVQSRARQGLLALRRALGDHVATGHGPGSRS